MDTSDTPDTSVNVPIKIYDPVAAIVLSDLAYLGIELAEYPGLDWYLSRLEE